MPSPRATLVHGRLIEVMHACVQNTVYAALLIWSIFCFLLAALCHASDHRCSWNWRSVHALLNCANAVAVERHQSVFRNVVSKDCCTLVAIL